MTVRRFREEGLRTVPAPRWFAVGSADAAQPDPSMRAADEALVHGGAKLLAQVRTRSAGAPVIGCTAAGEIATAGPNETSVVQGIHTEIQRLAAIAGQRPVAGFCTYGEIVRTRGMRGFHNQTPVVLSIS